ncbi:3070_t:CDS:2 [Cetraspora pellucida]|uniref:3070_t:CDS:1 n=1 Tax=Cetraspora pellucida TaxID=1433469 RepID=A0ACA9KWD4_9GLOM|nr:3070_t:CDS:2 [Cetraspora pellucida]
MQSQPPSGFALPNISTHNHCWNGFWHFSEKGAGNRYTAKCFYCKYELSGKLKKLHSHIIAYSKWPVTVKNNYIQKAASSTPKSHKTNLISSDQEQSDLFSPALKCQENLANWVIKPISQDKQFKIDKKLLDAIIYENHPFKIAKNSYFLEFLNELAPNYCLPSPETLSNKILNSSFSIYLNNKFKVMLSLTNITLALNRWQNVSQNSIYSFIALKEEQEHILDIIDLSANHHTAVFLQKKSKKFLN